MDDSASSGRTNIFKKIIGFLNPSSHEDDVTEEEIISMVNEGHEQGVLRASEAEMIHNIFEFGDKEAKDIMTHRKNLIAIDGELPIMMLFRSSLKTISQDIRFIWRTSIILSVFYILKTHLLLHRKMRYSVLPSKTLRG